MTVVLRSRYALFVANIVVLALAVRRGETGRINESLRWTRGLLLTSALLSIGTAFLPAELSWLKWVAAAALLVSAAGDSVPVGEHVVVYDAGAGELVIETPNDYAR